MQLLFEGQTERCLPEGWRGYEEDGIRPRYTPTHWSSVAVQKDFLKDLEKFIMEEAEQISGPEHARETYVTLCFLLLTDCYSTHICLEFVGWFKKRYDGISHPKGFLIYIPVGHTGDIQVCDLVVQKKVKSIFQDQSVIHVARCVRAGKSLDVRYAYLKPKILDWSLPVMDFSAPPKALASSRRGSLRLATFNASTPPFRPRLWRRRIASSQNLHRR